MAPDAAAVQISFDDATNAIDDDDMSGYEEKFHHQQTEVSCLVYRRFASSSLPANIESENILSDDEEVLDFVLRAHRRSSTMINFE